MEGGAVPKLYQHVLGLAGWGFSNVNLLERLLQEKLLQLRLLMSGAQALSQKPKP